MQSQKWQQNLDAFQSLWSDTPEVLRVVYEHESYNCRDALIFVFTSRILVIQAIARDDTVSVSSKSVKSFKNRRGFQKSKFSVWQQFIGKPFSWGWVTINQQGYCDGVLLSFDDVNPAVCLAVVASSIEICSIVRQKGPDQRPGQITRQRRSGAITS